MKKILLLSHSFPYGEGETYLEAELKYIPVGIECCILPIHSEGYQRKLDLPKKNVKVLELAKSKKTNKLLVLASPAYRAGLKELFNRETLTLLTAIELWKFCYSAQILYKRIWQTLKDQQIQLDGNTILYSYWMDSSALAVSLFQKYGVETVCRTHGADLYDERTSWGHQFLRKFLVANLDYVLPISKLGKEYLEKRVGTQDNILPMHLGVEDHGTAMFEKSTCIQIVSCSTVIQLKRLDVIVDALAQLTDVSFFWTHIGDGSELKAIQTRTKEKLAEGTFRFLGRLTNAEVHKFYRENNVMLFVNTSDTEGIPVSVMEAMSYGIPTIATDVGGTSELIHDGVNGFLIRQGAASELAKKIQEVYRMPDEEYTALRNKTREEFLSGWEAEHNYSEFYKIFENMERAIYT